MCDHNWVKVRNIAINENSKFKNSSLLYSGIQLRITFVNTLNNNIKDFHKKIEGQNEKISSLENENKIIKKDFASLEKNNKVLIKIITALQKQYNKMLEKLNAWKEDKSKRNNEIFFINDKETEEDNSDKNKNEYNKRLKSLDAVFIDNFNLISSVLSEPNKNLKIMIICYVQR